MTTMLTTTATTPWLLPSDEAARLDTLHRYADTSCLYEPVFDGLIDLTARIFNLPVAFVALVDAHEVLHKANNGQPLLIPRPRTGSVCALAIRYNTPLVFTDLAQQSQHAQLTEEAALAVQTLGLRFYAGVPLRMPNQQPIGTLCLVGYQPRAFGADEQRVLEQLGRLVEQTLVVRQQCLASSWLGEEHWSRIQTTLTEDLWELAALVRYLLKRSDHQAAVPAEVLKPVSRRLAELHARLVLHPGTVL